MMRELLLVYINKFFNLCAEINVCAGITFSFLLLLFIMAIIKFLLNLRIMSKRKKFIVLIIILFFITCLFFLFLFFQHIYILYFMFENHSNTTGEVMSGCLYSPIDEPSWIRYYFDKVCCVIGGKGWGSPSLTNDEIVHIAKIQARLLQNGLPLLSEDEIADNIYAGRGRDRLFVASGTAICLLIVWAKDGTAGLFRLFPFYIPRSKAPDPTDDNFQPYFKPSPEDYWTLD